MFLNEKLENIYNTVDERLKAMTKDEANKTLSYKDKTRWVELHNATANLYFIRNGNIEDVSPAGWWR